MSEVDWSKAPEGATHWGPETGSYYESFYKHSEDGWMAFNRRTGGAWSLLDAPMRDHRRNVLIKRPVDAWSGEGLPPVGAVCEWLQGSSHQWERIEILAYNGLDAWIRQESGRGLIVGNIANLRPLRTPEQIAAEEREEQLRQVEDALSYIVSRDFLRQAAEAVLDAGYRKVEGGAA